MADAPVIKANTRPDWADDTSNPQVEDPEMIASIEQAMTARGLLPAESTGGDTATAPQADVPPGASNQPGNAGEAGGVGPGTDAPVDEQGVGGTTPSTPDTTPVFDPAATYRVQLPTGDTWEMNQEQANYLLSVHQWVDTQPQQVKQQWKGIEDGTHTAIPAADYTAYQAWVAAGRPTNAPTEATGPTQPTRPDITQLDGETAAYIASLEARQTVTQDRPPTVTPSTPAPTDAEIQARIDAGINQRATQANDLNAASQAIANKYALDPQQLAHLTRVTTELQVVPAIAQRHTTYSQTGRVIQAPALQAVYTEAFEMAMNADPTLRAIRDDIIVQQHLAANDNLLGTVAAKKANAGSLATAPSAAVPGRETDVMKMTQQQRLDGATAELAAAMAEA